MTETQARPQLLEHLHKSLTSTPHCARWIPGTARFAVAGQNARNTGCLQVYELDGPELRLVHESEKDAGLKCASFGASGVGEAHLATGGFDGQLQVWDLEQSSRAVFSVQAHASIVNDLDAFGGKVRGYGPPELVTCGRDGCVRVWDVRQCDAPVAAFEPADARSARDCWCVAIGNAHSDEERCVLAGYDNGDVKLFDLRMNKVRWQVNVANGVCGVSFDRRDIRMNKFVAACLESQVHVFDARTQHPKKGFAQATERVPKGSTLWGVHHLPQNRDVVAVTAGDGVLYLYRYRYPDQRSVKDQDGQPLGVAGTLEQVTHHTLSSQPLNSLDWSPDKLGLFVCCALDQCVRVGVATRLNTL